MKMKRIISLALCFIMAFTLCQPVFAAGSTMTWTGASNEDWNVDGNWDPAQVPGLGDTAVIPASTVAAVVYDTTSVTLDCSGEVSVESGESLYLTGTSYLKGDGKLSGDGDITIMVDNSELQWSGVSIEGNGLFTVEANTRLVVDAVSDVYLSRPMTNDGEITVNDGNLLLSGGSGGTGTFAVSDGAYLHFVQNTYNIGGNFVNSGDVSIWDSSSVRFNAGYRQESTGTLSLKVWGLNNFNKLEITGQAELGGVLEVDLINDYVPQPGDTFEIMTYGSRIGTFSSITSNMPDITFEPTYTANSLTLTVSDEAAPGENVCEIDGTGYPTLDQALAMVQSGETKTIRLLDNIDYDGGIVIEDKSITFDLNECTLNVVNNAEADTLEEMSGLFVKGNATVALEGEGEFNVTGTWYGVFAECESENGEIASATVTNATGIERDGVKAQCSRVTVKGDATSNGSEGYGLCASYENAEVTVEGDVYANGNMSVGVGADSNAIVTVNGNITVNGSDAIGIEAYDDGEVNAGRDVTASGDGSVGIYAAGSCVTVAGNVTGDHGGAYATASSSIEITGNVRSTDVLGFGVQARDNCAIDVGGNVWSNGRGAWIWLEPGEGLSEITIDGVIDAPEYIRIGNEILGFEDYFLDSENIDGYRIYSDESLSLGGVLVANFAGGDGSEQNPYLVADADQLNNVRNHLDKHFRQIQSISLSGYSTGEGWEPIGDNSTPFTGTFDGGDEYTISGLVINRSDIDNNYMGLFGCTGAVAEIRNLGLANVNVNGSNYVGGLVGRNDGLVTNSYVTGDVTGRSEVGGLVGQNDGSVTDSYFTGTAIDTWSGTIGGLIGENNGTIINCHADVTVTSDNSYVGGLVGSNYGGISESYAVGEVEGKSEVGGLVGYNSGGNIDKSYATGTVTGTETDTMYIYTLVGGLVGSNSGPISDSYARGAVSGQEDVGGLVGYNRSLITNSYATGTVNGDSYIGGLAGFNHSDGNIMSSYWDTETSLQASSDGGTGKTTAEMKEETTFTGWDFNTIWGINGSDNNGYPFLRWQGYDGGQTNEPPVLSAVGVSAVTQTTATLNFTSDKAGTYYYLVYAAGDTAPDAATIKTQGEAAAKGTGTAAAAANAAQVTGLTASTAYKAYVIVEDAEENISNVAVIGFTTLEAAPTVPTGPQNFTASPGDGQVVLSWTAPGSDGGSAIIKYQVSKDNGANWTDVGLNTSHTFIGLTNGTEYTFKVRAVNSIGNGAEASVTATPTAAPIGPDVTPASLNITTGGTGTFTISLGQSGNEADSATVSSNDTSIATANPATVTTSGQAITVTGVSAGNTTVTITFSGGSYTGGDKTVSVTVTDPVYATHIVNFYSNGSLYAGKTVTSGSALGNNWPGNPTRSGYSFGGWFTEQNGAGTLYISSTIITADVDLYAKWTYNGGGSGGGGGGSTPTTPAYKADLKAENGTETTLPVKVDKDAGTASIDADSQSFAQGGTVITIPSIPDVDTYSAGIPVPDLSTTDVQGTLTLNTDAGSITVPSNMLTGVADADGNKAQITIGQGDKSNLPENVKDTIGDRPLVQLTLSIDGKRTDWSNQEAPVTVSIPYTPTAAELASPESIVIWYIDGSGNVVSVPNGHYDPETGTVTFTTTHFSYYAVSYNQMNFKDVANDAWYAKAVSFIAAREITIGTGGGNFSPEAKLTRGEFLVMLIKAYGIAPDLNPKDNFADSGNTYYTGYLAAAKRLGISTGVGNNMFAPEKEITRQEMFTLLYNALKVIGKLPQGNSGKTLSDFTDANSVADWAEEAMTLLVKTGTIGGSNGVLTPLSTTTRAEMAQVLYNLLGK